jgi:hypothetical protein
MAAGSPAAPDPIITTSASRSQLCSVAACAIEMSSTIFLKSAIDYIRMEENASYEIRCRADPPKGATSQLHYGWAAEDLWAKPNLVTLNYLKRPTADVEEKWFKKSGDGKCDGLEKRRRSGTSVRGDPLIVLRFAFGACARVNRFGRGISRRHFLARLLLASLDGI